MAEKKDPVATMSKAAIMKEFGPKIIKQFGKDELDFIKGESTGPGGVDTLRRYVRDYFYNRGGAVVKRSNTKKMMRGGAVAKKKMRGGGMMKTAAKKKIMRGGAVAKKKMARGGVAKKK
jgi:cyclophilin family peptidyl-prolyl cis-trans isomerase